MPSLHIEHPITDLTTWTKAFSAFADARRAAGVISERVRQPVDDDRSIVVDLDFETTDKAAAFLEFLRTVVWANADASPALAGTPEATVLRSVEIPTS
jgi:hypothetical protein